MQNQGFSKGNAQSFQLPTPISLPQKIALTVQVGDFGGIDVGQAGATNQRRGIAHAQIDGPLVSETHVLLTSGARIGREDAPTTVNAGAVIAEEGVIAHGTVWAREAGVVWGGAA